jgi:hypothetical protein
MYAFLVLVLTGFNAFAQDAKSKKNVKAPSEKEQLAALMQNAQESSFTYRPFITLDEQTTDNIRGMQKPMVAEDVMIHRSTIFITSELLKAEQTLIRYSTWFEKAAANRVMADATRLLYAPKSDSPLQIVNDNGGVDPSLKQMYAEGKIIAEINKLLSQDEYNDLQHCLNYLGINLSELELYAYYLSPRAEVIGMVKQLESLGTRLQMWILANDIRQSLYLNNPGIDPIAFNR